MEREKRMSFTTYSSEYFVGREQQLNKVNKVIEIAAQSRKGNMLVLLGTARSGKTWLLQAINEQQAVSVDNQTMNCMPIWLDPKDFAKRELLIKSLKGRIKDFLQKAKLDHQSFNRVFDKLDLTKRFDTSVSELMAKLAVVPVLIVDDYQRVQKQYPEVDHWFLTIFSKSLTDAGFVVLLASRFALEKNPFRKPEEQIRPYSLPIVLTTTPFSVAEIEILLARRYPGFPARNAAAVRLYTWTGGHPGRSVDLLDSIVSQQSDEELLKLTDFGLEHDFFEDDLPQDLLIQRRGLAGLIEIISVLRLVTVKILEELQIPQISQATNGKAYTLINGLLQIGLISYVPEKGGYIVDNSLRMPFERKLFCSNRLLWSYIHRQVYNLYWRWLGEYPYEPIAYLLEWFYHFLSSTAFDQDLNLHFKENLANLDQIITFDDHGRQKLADDVITDNLIEIQVVANQAQDAYQQIIHWMQNSRKGVDSMQESYWIEPDELVGKERRQQLKDILTELSGDSSRLILVTGDGGIGKTFMIKKVIDGVMRAGMRERFLVPGILDDEVDDEQMPQESGYGYQDFTDANLRDPFWLLSHITHGLRVSARQANLFSMFDKQKDAYYDKDNTLRLLVDGRIGQQAIYKTWIDEYNEFANNSDRIIFLCFDTTERIADPESPIMKFFFSEQGIGKLRNTKVLLAGRQDETWRNHVIESSRVALGDKKLYELKPLDRTDISDFLKHIDVYCSEDRLGPYELISRGYPVILTVFARLADDQQSLVVEEVGKKALAKGIDLTLPTEEFSKIQKDYLLRLCFDEVSKRFIAYQRGENADEMSLYQILFVARRGLTPELLAFLQGHPSEHIKASEILNEWYDTRSLLLKKVYKMVDNIAEQDFMIVFHDVVYEHAVALDEYFYNQNHSRLLAEVVEYYRQQLKLLENSSSEINSRPEKHRSLVFDLLYYEYILSPWTALSLFADKLDFAYRHHDTLMARLLLEEWQRLQTDRAAQNFLGKNPGMPGEFLNWYQLLTTQRFLTDNPRIQDKNVTFSNQIFSSDNTEHANEARDGFVSLDSLVLDIKNSRLELLPQYQEQFTLISLRAKLAWCINCFQKGDYKDASKLQDLKDHFNNLIAGFSELKAHLLLADTYFLRSEYWQAEQRWISAIADLRQAVKIYHQHKIFLAESRCISNLVRLFLKYGMNNQVSQIFNQSVTIAQEDGSDSPSRFFAACARGNLHAANGNYLHAATVFESDLTHFRTKNIELDRLPTRDRFLFLRDGARIKARHILLKLTLLDFLDVKQMTWDTELLDFEKWISNAYQYVETNVFDQAELHLIRANFYLDILACHRLVPIVTEQNNRNKILSIVVESVKVIESACSVSELEQYTRLADFYEVRTRLAFAQGEWNLAKEIFGNILPCLNELPEQERDQRKAGQSSDFVNLPVQQLEKHRLDAIYQLLAGNMVLVDQSEELPIPKKVELALVSFLDALQILSKYPELMFTNIAVEQIWRYLLEAEPLPQKLCSILQELLSGEPDGSPGWLLQSGLPTICPAAA